MRVFHALEEERIEMKECYNSRDIGGYSISTLKN